MAMQRIENHGPKLSFVNSQKQSETFVYALSFLRPKTGKIIMGKLNEKKTTKNGGV